MKAKHGGARPGSGRKPTGRQTVGRIFSLPRTTVEALDAIPKGQQSAFVNRVLCKSLGL